MRNARETLDYYNRKFVVNATGFIRDFDGKMNFKLPPLNDTGFSSGYNQCLMRIKQVIIGINTPNLADQVNPVFVSNNGGGLSQCATGIIVRTSIPSRQVKSVSADYLVAQFPEGHDQSFHQLINVETKPTYIRSATQIDGKTVRGSKQIMEIPVVAAAAGTEHLVNDSCNFFEYLDSGSFEDSAVLCGVPFGQEHHIQLRDAFNGQTLGGLASGVNLANGRNSTEITVKFEILMLPNPTPDN
jgi:hypothetical protein